MSRIHYKPFDFTDSNESDYLDISMDAEFSTRQTISSQKVERRRRLETIQEIKKLRAELRDDPSLDSEEIKDLIQAMYWSEIG